MDIEDSDKIATHIKTDTIKLQKRLNKKINTKYNPTENEITNPTKVIKHKLQNVDINQLQEQRKNQKPTPNPSTESKNKFKNIEQMKIEMDSAPTIKKLGQPEQKAQALVGLAGRVHTKQQSDAWKTKRHIQTAPSQIQCSPLRIKNKVTYGNE